MIRLVKQRPAHGMAYIKTEDLDPEKYFLSLCKRWFMRLLFGSGFLVVLIALLIVFFNAFDFLAIPFSLTTEQKFYLFPVFGFFVGFLCVLLANRLEN